MSFLLHLYTMIVMLYVSLPLLQIAIFSIVLILNFLSIMHHCRPHTHYKCLDYKSNSWFLTAHNGNSVSYEKVIILVDTSFLMLVKLVDKSSKNKLLVVFYDQLTKSQSRFLHLKNKKIL